MGTLQGGEGQDPHGRRPHGPGPQPGNRTSLIALAVVVIAVCVVVLFAISGGSGSASPQLSADDCTTAEGAAVACDAADAAYRVLETHEDVPESAAHAACAAVPGVVASYWVGGGDGPDTAYCLGRV